MLLLGIHEIVVFLIGRQVSSALKVACNDCQQHFHRVRLENIQVELDAPLQFKVGSTDMPVCT